MSFTATRCAVSLFFWHWRPLLSTSPGSRRSSRAFAFSGWSRFLRIFLEIALPHILFVLRQLWRAFDFKLCGFKQKTKNKNRLSGFWCFIGYGSKISLHMSFLGGCNYPSLLSLETEDKGQWKVVWPRIPKLSKNEEIPFFHFRYEPRSNSNQYTICLECAREGRVGISRSTLSPRRHYAV